MRGTAHCNLSQGFAPLSGPFCRPGGAQAVNYQRGPCQRIELLGGAKGINRKEEHSEVDRMPTYTWTTKENIGTGFSIVDANTHTNKRRWRG